MYAALDVQYDDEHRQALAAAVVFRDWLDAEPAAEHTVVCRDIVPYVPGQFFRRELPCLLTVIQALPKPLTTIVIDGYVQLGDKPGLGMYLWGALDQQIPVIGVAKTAFHSAWSVEVKRGESNSPLFVTAVGIDPLQAASDIRRMAGPYRIPNLLKRVDQLARTPSPEGDR